MQVCRARGKTAILYFIDLKAAFYSTIRSLFLPTRNDAGDRGYIFHSHEIPLVLTPLFEAILQHPGALAELEDQPHLLALLIEGHHDAHLGVRHEGCQAVARPRRGSRPGSSLADAIFN
eukprot:5799761-Pyramimonas_sp.AAC.1